MSENRKQAKYQMLSVSAGSNGDELTGAWVGIADGNKVGFDPVVYVL